MFPIDILKEIGLSKKESEVYISLLRYGDQSVGVISKKSGVNRSTCYQIMSDLKDKGLVSSYKKRDVLFYHADKTNGLLMFLKNKKDEIDDKINFLNSNFHIIQAIANSLSYKPKVEFYEGFEGIKKIYYDTIEENKNSEILAFFGKDFYPDELKNFITNTYLPQRLEKKIKVKAIIESQIYSELDKKQLRERVTYKLDKQLQVEINIYNKRVAFIAYSNNQYVGVVIEDEKISDALRGIHYLIWNLLRNKKT
jgi:sugar-specific transcriptional regulator TrmB